MVVIVTVAIHLPQKKLIQLEFLCGCGRPAASRKSLGGEHNGRMFYRCGNGWVENSDGLNEKLWWKRVSYLILPFSIVYISYNVAACSKNITFLYFSTLVVKFLFGKMSFRSLRRLCLSTIDLMKKS